MKFTRVRENGEDWYITQSGLVFHIRNGEHIYKAEFRTLKQAREYVKSQSYLFFAKGGIISCTHF